MTELSHDTIDEYYEYFLNRKYDVNSFDSQDIEKLSRFFDIYENYESNNEIINITPEELKRIWQLGKATRKYIVDTFIDYVKENNIVDEIITVSDYDI